jgi:hypothetical protein
MALCFLAKILEIQHRSHLIITPLKYYVNEKQIDKIFYFHLKINSKTTTSSKTPIPPVIIHVTGKQVTQRTLLCRLMKSAASNQSATPLP